MGARRAFLREIRRGFAVRNTEQAKRRIGPTEHAPFHRKGGRHKEKFFIPCCAGMEDIAAAELENPLVGATEIEKTAAGVTFRGESMQTGYAACLWHRTGHRILHCLHKSKLPTNLPPSQSLSDFVAKMRSLERSLQSGSRIGLKSSVWHCTTVKDADTVNLLLSRAIQSRAAIEGYTVDIAEGGSMHVDVPFYATVYRNNIILYRDLSGPALNRLSIFQEPSTPWLLPCSRGYRRVLHPAALTEASAAGLLFMADWNRLCEREGAVFVDPMCGSGTLLCEAALMATHHAPGLLRHDWPFMRWPDFDARAWAESVQGAVSKRRPWNGHILGCDVHPIAIHLGQETMEAVGVAENVELTTANCREWKLDRRPDVVVTNPPWGLKRRREFPPFRLVPDLKQAWGDLGEFLWRECKGSKAYFLCNHPFLYKSTGLFVTERSPLWIGGVHLGVYGIHLHNTEAIGRHSDRRPYDAVSNSMPDRRREKMIREAVASLNVSPDAKHVCEAGGSDVAPPKKPTFSWKYMKYQTVD